MAFEIDELLGKDKKTIKAVEKETPEKKEETKKTSSKMGRPKKQIKADKRIVCYLTEEENKKFEEMADLEMMNKSAYTRKIIVDFLKSR